MHTSEVQGGDDTDGDVWTQREMCGHTGCCSTLLHCGRKVMVAAGVAPCAFLPWLPDFLRIHSKCVGTGESKGQIIIW